VVGVVGGDGRVGPQFIDLLIHRFYKPAAVAMWQVTAAWLRDLGFKTGPGQDFKLVLTASLSFYFSVVGLE
jgi:hypothetical protein